MERQINSIRYAVGLTIATPAQVIKAIDIFPHNRGLAASMQFFMQNVFLMLIAGVMAPLLSATGIGLAWGMVGGLAAGAVCLGLFIVIPTQGADCQP